jgi:plastocyanin
LINRFSQYKILLFTGVFIILVLALTSCSSTASTTSSTSTSTLTTTSSATSGNRVTIDLVAKNMAFDRSSLNVPAGAEVTITFNNQDSGISHNFAVYTDSTASKSIFVGKVITGVASITYTFTAPSTPETYFFRCDIHPSIMTGSFIVD